MPTDDYLEKRYEEMLAWLAAYTSRLQLEAKLKQVREIINQNQAEIDRQQRALDLMKIEYADLELEFNNSY